MMNVRCGAAGIALLVALSASATATAQMQVHVPHYPPTQASDEINNSWPVGASAANTAGTLIAAGKMGARFYGNAIVGGTDAALLQKCKNSTPAGSTWPEQCHLGGLASALSQQFSQNWVVSQQPGTAAGKNTAVNTVINSLAVYRSPAIVPLRGSADHWLVIFRVTADRSTSPYTLDQVRFFDAGDTGDSFNPYTDAKGSSYYNGTVAMQGNAWKDDYYWMLDNIAPTDPFYQKYVVAYDPPPSQPILFTDVPVIYKQAPGVLVEGEEMDAQVAADRVKEALWLAGLDDDPMFWDPIERAEAGEAWAVYGETLEGEPMDYFLVPLLDEYGDAAALVRLSMVDGAFEHIWVPDRSIPFLGVTQEEASLAAREILGEDERLHGGDLVWNPRRAYARSALLPYYEFHILGTDDEYRGSIAVALADGRVRGVEQSVPIQAAVTR
ncbi:MAG TPA: hypothetical protein VLS89_12875 [Candidatus Nanopelagicales bacterium]|nr:hypothetical protein [Candidatus Nanopelagicales bacterium]